MALTIGPLFGYGPLEVRWYGLMYLDRLRRRLARRARARQAAVEPHQARARRRPRVLRGARRDRRRARRLHAHLRLERADLGSVEHLQGVAGRHVVPRRLRRRARRDVALRPRDQQPFFVVTDFVAPWTAIGLGAGRLGNFINGELWGKPTSPDAPWAVIVDGQARHASQLYEVFLEGIVLFFVLWLYSRKPRPVMATSGLFLVVYGSGGSSSSSCASRISRSAISRSAGSRWGRCSRRR